MKKNKRNKIIALIVTCINALIVFRSLSLLYKYNFTSGLFAFMIPNNFLFVDVLLGMIGIYKSMLLCKGKFGMIPFLIATLAIWFILFVHNDGWWIFQIVKL